MFRKPTPDPANATVRGRTDSSPEMQAAMYDVLEGTARIATKAGAGRQPISDPSIHSVT